MEVPVVLTELGVALDFEASPRILRGPIASFTVSGRESHITITISDVDAVIDFVRRAEALGTTGPLGHEGTNEATHTAPSLEVMRKEQTKDAWTYVTKSKDTSPRWFLSTGRKLGEKTYSCEATLLSEGELAAALAACESLRVAKRAPLMRIGE
jgi:hypothetical protein